MGRWTKKHEEAIYGTRKGLTNYLTDVKNSFSKDGRTAYIYVEEVVDRVKIKGLFANAPARVRVVGSDDTELDFKLDRRVLTIDLTGVAFDPTVTVLALDFEDDIKEPSPAMTVNMESAEQVVNGQGDHQDIIDNIIERVSYGDGLFRSVLSEDGERLDFAMGNPTVGAWVRKHAEALHKPRQGIARSHFKGMTALSEDKQTLYLFVKGKPTGPVAIKGLKNSIARIRIVGEGSMLPHQMFNKLYWSAVPGVVYIDIPADRLDENVTVIAVLLDKPIELYTEEVKAIESNL